MPKKNLNKLLAINLQGYKISYFREKLNFVKLTVHTSPVNVYIGNSEFVGFYKHCRLYLSHKKKNSNRSHNQRQNIESKTGCCSGGWKFKCNIFPAFQNSLRRKLIVTNERCGHEGRGKSLNLIFQENKFSSFAKQFRVYNPLIARKYSRISNSSEFCSSSIFSEIFHCLQNL